MKEGAYFVRNQNNQLIIVPERVQSRIHLDENGEIDSSDDTFIKWLNDMDIISGVLLRREQGELVSIKVINNSIMSKPQSNNSPIKDGIDPSSNIDDSESSDNPWQDKSLKIMFAVIFAVVFMIWGLSSTGTKGWVLVISSICLIVAAIITGLRKDK